MERYLEIGKENLKHNMPMQIVAALLLLCLSPLIMGISNLGVSDSAKVLEMYVALIGILLLTPIFLPEQNRDLRDLVASKYTRTATVYLIRVLESLFVISLFLGAYIWILIYNKCVFDVEIFYFGTWAEALFLGGLGVFAYGLCDNLVIGYMLPLFYYLIAVGSGEKYLKNFYIFSMMKGSYQEKYYLLMAGIILLVIGIFLRSVGDGVFFSFPRPKLK